MHQFFGVTEIVTSIVEIPIIFQVCGLEDDRRVHYFVCVVRYSVGCIFT